jgi:hypothetical protein
LIERLRAKAENGNVESGKLSEADFGDALPSRVRKQSRQDGRQEINHEMTDHVGDEVASPEIDGGSCQRHFGGRTKGVRRRTIVTSPSR